LDIGGFMRDKLGSICSPWLTDRL